MARPRQEQQLLTPGRQPPLSPQLDNSLITSAARKRKGEGRGGGSWGGRCAGGSRVACIGGLGLAAARL